MFLLPLLVLLDLPGSWMPREARVCALGRGGHGGSAPGHNLCHFHHRHCHGFPVGSTGLPPRTSCWKEGSLGFIHLFLQHLLIDGWSWWSCPGSLCHPSVHSGPCRRDQEGTEVALLQGLALSILLTFPWLQGVMAEPKALPFLLLMLV